MICQGSAKLGLARLQDSKGITDLKIVQYKGAKLPKSGKLEKSKNKYNFFKIVTIVVNFGSGIVKFDFGLRNNILEFASSFVFFRKNYFVFLKEFRLVVLF